MQHLYQTGRSNREWRLAMVTYDDAESRFRAMPVGTILFQVRDPMNAWLTVATHAEHPNDIAGVVAEVDDRGLNQLYFDLSSLEELERMVDHHDRAPNIRVGHRVRFCGGEFHGVRLAGLTGVVTDFQDRLLVYDATFQDNSTTILAASMRLRMPSRSKYYLPEGYRGVRLDSPIADDEHAAVSAVYLERIP